VVNYEKTVSKDYIYKGKVVNLRVDDVVLPNNKRAQREIVEHAGAVGIIAINEKKEIILVKQYRKPVEEILFEIPAGKLEKDEEPIECAKREMEEETGFTPLNLKKIAEFYTSPGFSSEKLTLFYTDRIKKTEQTKGDPDEFLDVVTIGLNQAFKMLKSGQIMDAKTIIGILIVKEQYRHLLERG